MVNRLFLRATLLSGLAAVAFAGSACGHNAADEATDADSAKLLPNEGLIRGTYDTSTFVKIADHFAAKGFDLSVTDSTSFAPTWPLADSQTTVLNRLGTPITYSNIGYFSSGFNIVRSSPSLSDDVRAPHAGSAIAFDWLGNPISPTSVVTPYSSFVAIYDAQTHLITILAHVSPAAGILSSTSATQVAAGASIGRLARAPVASFSDAVRLANVEVVFFDVGNKKLLDPARVFAAYKDAIPPEAANIYLTNDERESTDQFRNGKFDIIVEAFDRDDASNRNLEVSAIAFTIRDQDAHELVTLPRCEIARDVFGDVATRQESGGDARLHDLIDFKAAMGQQSGGWPMSDVDNSQRTFRYALSHLAVDSVTGKCSVRADDDGFVDLPNAATKLDVSVSLWDAKGNTADKTFSIDRVPNSQEFSVGGTITGLVGDVTLRSNAKDLVVSANGDFQFATPITVTTLYRVTVKTQPPHQRCTVTNPSGTMGTANVTDVAVACVNVRTIGGTLSGLGSDPVILQNNAGDNLRLTADGAFTFPKAIEQGGAYAVTILTQPGDATCAVQNASGTTSTSDIANVAIVCN